MTDIGSIASFVADVMQRLGDEAPSLRVHVVANDASERSLARMHEHLETSEATSPAVAIVYGRRSVERTLTPFLDDMSFRISRKRMVVLRAGPDAAMYVVVPTDAREFASKIRRFSTDVAHPSRKECVICLEEYDDTFACSECFAPVCVDCFAKTTRANLFTDAWGDELVYTCPICRHAMHAWDECYPHLPLKVTENVYPNALAAIEETIREIEPYRPADEHAPPGMIVIANDERSTRFSFNVALKPPKRRGKQTEYFVDMMTRYRAEIRRHLKIPGTIFAVGWLPAKCKTCARACGHDLLSKGRGFGVVEDGGVAELTHGWAGVIGCRWDE